MARGSNLLRVSGFNQAVVLEAVRRSKGTISRVELVQSTGLSNQTVSNIVRKLLDIGLITEGQKTVSGLGKPRTPLAINPGGRYSIGVHLDPSVMTFVILDLNGSVIARSRDSMPAVAEPAVTIRRMAGAIDELIAAAGIPRDRVLGVGIASPGPIDMVNGIVVGPPLLIGWHTVPLRESLREATGLPVLLDKDVMAAAHAELWLDDTDGHKNFALIYLGAGIGAGLVVNGEVLRGSSNNVGELGHFSSGIDGPLCTCGRSECVGVALMPAYLVKEALRTKVIGGPVDTDEPAEIAIAFMELSRRAAAGNLTAREIIDLAATRLARAVEDVANLLDTDRIIFGGPAWPPLSERFLAVMVPALKRRSAVGAIHDIAAVGSVLGEDIAAIGAGCAILDHFLSPKSTALLLQE